jgi:hypothetical protein
MRTPASSVARTDGTNSSSPPAPLGLALRETGICVTRFGHAREQLALHSLATVTIQQLIACCMNQQSLVHGSKSTLDPGFHHFRITYRQQHCAHQDSSIFNIVSCFLPAIPTFLCLHNPVLSSQDVAYTCVGFIMRLNKYSLEKVTKNTQQKHVSPCIQVQCLLGGTVWLCDNAVLAKEQYRFSQGLCAPCRVTYNNSTGNEKFVGSAGQNPEA